MWFVIHFLYNFVWEISFVVVELYIYVLVFPDANANKIKMIHLTKPNPFLFDHNMVYPKQHFEIYQWIVKCYVVNAVKGRTIFI